MGRVDAGLPLGESLRAFIAISILAAAAVAPKTAIGTEGAGHFAMIADTEGNTVGLHTGVRRRDYRCLACGERARWTTSPRSARR